MRSAQPTNKREIDGAKFDVEKTKPALRKQLSKLTRQLMEDIDQNSKMLKMNYKKHGEMQIQCTYPKLSKILIDEIDTTLADVYGFTKEECDFILNFDYKYRVGIDESTP